MINMEKTINTDNMVHYYQNEFDVIDFKYRLSEDVLKDNPGMYAEIAEYEASHQFACLTKKHYADDHANLNLVYDAEKQNEKSLNLLDLILNKVISQYINIDGMERLFSEKYIEFEWEMHLSADYEKHNMKFYRDHFIHQVRDAYTMQMLMDHFGFYEEVKKVLENESESKVSRFVHRCLVQQRHCHAGELRKEVLKYDEDFYIRNMIYMASYMAALFHDIGYPEAYYMTTSRHIMDYLANLYHLNAGSGDIRGIYSLLQNSLLFRLVPFEEIERRYNKLEKPEHGTLSAIVFLLHFYENGAIFRLPPYKMAAVELAALAIYNHTNKYGVTSKKKIADAYRPSFSLNPISYMLRVCDDLQEWDRIYFVISNKSNPLFCSRCRTPIIRKLEAGNREGIAKYGCNCPTAVGHCERDKERLTSFSQAFDGNAKFLYRRIYNVSVCDRLELQQTGGKLRVLLNYDIYKLLHIAYVDPTYARYRIDELNSLKRMFEEQDGIPKIYLDYFVTSNPVHIKVRMIEKYLYKAKNTGKQLDGLYADGANSELMDRVEKELFDGLKKLMDDFFMHENLCKECGYCENFIHALPDIVYQDGDNTTETFSSCQTEVNRKLLSGIVLSRHSPAETDGNGQDEILKLRKPLESMMEEKKLRCPDFARTIMRHGDKKACIFFKHDEMALEDCAKALTGCCPVNRLRMHVEQAARMYIRLFVCQELFKRNNMKAVEGLDAVLLKLGQEMSEAYQAYPELQCMVEDCFLQFSKMYLDITAMDSYPDRYYEQYANGKRKQFLYDGWEDEAEDYYYTAVFRYIDPEKYVPILERKHSNKNIYVDAYTDLYLFQLIYKEIS